MRGDSKLTAFFFQRAARHKRDFVLGFALMPICAGLAVAGPKLLQLVIDEGIQNRDFAYIVWMSVLYLLSIGGLLAAVVGQGILLQTAGLRTLNDIRSTVVRHVSGLGKGLFERRPLGVFVSRATSDVEAIGESLSSGIVSIIQDLVTIIAVFAMIFYQDVDVAVRMLLMLPVLVFVIEIFRRLLRTNHERLRTLNGRMSAQLNEAVVMRHEIKNFDLGGALEDEFEETNVDYRETSVKVISMDAATFSIIEGMNYIAIGALILFGVLAGSSSLMTPGEVVMYIGYINLLFTPFKQLGQRFNVMQASFAALTKIDDVVSMPLPEDTGVSEPTAGTVAMDRVTFAYREGRKPVLRDVSFEIPDGSSLAIVGPTGSGKTTIVRLLTRLYDVVDGVVTIGNRDIREVSRDELRKHIVLVPQEPAIFRGSVLDNITLFRPELDVAAVREVCRNIRADDFISRMPEGYETELQSEGANISAGQRQLIALARALVSGAEILVFDESTANIDTETERMIQEALAYVMERRTTVLIAHRLSTIRHVDRILVLRQGEIVQSGSHAELVQQEGLYRLMLDLQSGGQTSAFEPPRQSGDSGVAP